MSAGNFLEDFEVGRRFLHATPRTIGEGDASLAIALTGGRNPLPCSEPFARSLGFPKRPLDDLLVFNIAFGKTVPDISFNAVANLGYADVRFIAPVFAGDTIGVETEVFGRKASSSGDRGVVWVRSSATNQRGEEVLSWCRWVLVRSRGPVFGIEEVVPPLPGSVAPAALVPPAGRFVDLDAIASATGSDRFWEGYRPGDRIDHPAGMTLDESDHVFATRLYQNNAQVHFDGRAMASTAHGRRLVYGGHVISVARALSFDGLENALTILAIDAGSHAAPTFAGDTLRCFTQVVEALEMPGRRDVGALRLKLVALRNADAADVPADSLRGPDGRHHPAVVLDLDLIVSMPRTQNGDSLP